MDWQYLYTQMDGRIGRKQFWLGAVVMVVIGIVLSILVNFFTGGFNMTPAADAETAMAAFRAACIANIVVFVLLVWPLAALMIKRRHDRGSSGNDVWAYIGLALVAQLLTLFGIDYSAVQIPGTDSYVVTPGFMSGGLGFIVGIFALYLLVVCGFLKGNEGANAYGPDPLAS